jgi:hypothetical protein
MKKEYDLGGGTRSKPSGRSVRFLTLRTARE